MTQVEGVPSTTNALEAQLRSLETRDPLVAWNAIDRGNWEMPQILGALDRAGFDTGELLRKLKGNTPVRDSTM